MSVFGVFLGQFTPQPERFTELYFSDHTHLPAVLNPQVPQQVRFTTHNLEHQLVDYRYDIVAVAPGSKDVLLAHGGFSLPHQKAKTITQTIIIPSLGDSVKISVRLHYRGVTAGRVETHLEQQSIDYWLRAPGGTHAIS